MKLGTVFNLFASAIRYKKVALTAAQIKSLNNWNEEMECLLGPVITSKGANSSTSAVRAKAKENRSAKADAAEKTSIEKPREGLLKNNTDLEKHHKTSQDPSEDFSDYEDAPNEYFKSINEDGKIRKDSFDPSSHDQLSPVQEFQKLALNHVLEMPLFTLSNLDSPTFWKNFKSPSVSRVLQESMSEENLLLLVRWERNMIAAMGKEQFEKYKADMLSAGKHFHFCLNNVLEGKLLNQITPEIEGYWNSLQPVLQDISDVVATEQMVTNQTLNYRGIFDCVASYHGKPCLIDWKTSRKQKPTLNQTFDNPLQLVAYLAAFNNCLLNDVYENNPAFNSDALKKSGIHKDGKLLENCLLVISYEDGSKADVHFMNRNVCKKYWTQWLQRLHKYWSKSFV